MKTVLIYLTIFNLLFFPTLSWADVNNLLIQKITREYVDERRSIEVGFRVARESKFAYEKLIVLKVVSEIGSDLSDLSSPTSQALGESYVSVVRELAEDMGDELDESSKNLFTNLKLEKDLNLIMKKKNLKKKKKKIIFLKKNKINKIIEIFFKKS